MKQKKMTTEEFGLAALRKMAEIAGHDYDDCIVIEPGGKKRWRYEFEWTEDQELTYRSWFISQPFFASKKLAEREFTMWNLMYGFKISDDETK